MGISMLAAQADAMKRGICMKRDWLFFLTGTIALAAAALGAAIYGASRNAEEPTASFAYRSSQPAVEAMARPYELVLAHTYLCGLKDEVRKELKDVSLEQALTQYSGWEIISAQKGKLILLKRENDIAPACKANGYFGLSADGMLTLFNGLPAEQDVIQTFYQINTKRMEARLPKEEIELLHKGIRVRDLAEYNSVLSTYGEFQSGVSEAH